jgi:hypothetical protein
MALALLQQPLLLIESSLFQEDLQVKPFGIPPRFVYFWVSELDNFLYFFGPF